MKERPIGGSAGLAVIAVIIFGGAVTILDRGRGARVVGCRRHTARSSGEMEDGPVAWCLLTAESLTFDRTS